MREGYLERLERLRPIDDDYARCIFKGQAMLAGAVLSVVMDEEIQVREVRTQYDLNVIAGGRSVTADVYCIGEDGTHYDLETQRDRRGASARRARYHASVMDVDFLKANADFSTLPALVVVFICERDPYGFGSAAYRFSMHDEAGTLMGDETRFVFANASYVGDGSLGDLMHDMLEVNPDKMRFSAMAERVRYLKRTEEGVREMCEVFDEIRQEGVKEGIDIGRSEGIDIGRCEQVLSSARNLMESMSVGVVRALELLGISEHERPYFQELLESGATE